MTTSETKPMRENKLTDAIALVMESAEAFRFSTGGVEIPNIEQLIIEHYNIIAGDAPEKINMPALGLCRPWLQRWL